MVAATEAPGEAQSWQYPLAQLRAFGLLASEYAQVIGRLGREPNLVELGIIGAMWSEHCGYKHSRQLLKLLPTAGPRVVQGPGENAGAVDIGDGLAVALKMESHNHPSAVEPLQGAATGVGGILRDIFTMGARPVAILDSLRFGSPDDARTPYLVSGVIAGIGFYGNCVGVPTVGGEISFHPSYIGNPLVNAMCVGILPIEKLTRAGASGAGNLVLLVGADTGRDGIQGAAFASNNDPEASHRGVIQVGNPFLEKLLLEACLSFIDSGKAVAMQDLGAAGLTSSSVEMAARGGMGVDLDVARVPRRETGMNAFEVMLSESQERMLVLVRPEDEEAAIQHFGRWELQVDVIGSVTTDGLLRVRDGQRIEAELPISLLTDEVPAYTLAPEPPAATETGSRELPRLADAALDHAARRLLASPNIASRWHAFGQYDSTVQGNTVLGPGAAAAVVRVDGTSRGLAMVTDCNPRYTQVDPRRGAQQAVAEAARNLACVGARAIAVTDCLNFGNPEKPGVAWQLTEAVNGLAEACRALEVPVVSGNVSLYNETAGQSIAPTPAIGMVGLLEDVAKVVRTGFHEGDAVLLVGEAAHSLGASEFRAVIHADEGGPFPRFDLAAERQLSELLIHLADRGLVTSMQDVSEGGLLVALAECCFAAGRGVTLEATAVAQLTAAAGGRLDAALFSEDQGRAVVACRPEMIEPLLQTAERAGVPAWVLGTAGGNRFTIGDVLNAPLAEWQAAWEGGFAALLDR